MAGESHLITEVEEFPLLLRGVGAERGEEALERDASGVAARWGEEVEAERLQALSRVVRGAWSRDPHPIASLNEFGAPGHAWPLPPKGAIKRIRHNQVIHEWESFGGIKNYFFLVEPLLIEAFIHEWK